MRGNEKIRAILWPSEFVKGDQRPASRVLGADAREGTRDRHCGKNNLSSSRCRIFAGSATSSFDIDHYQQNPGLFFYRGHVSGVWSWGFKG